MRQWWLKLHTGDMLPATSEEDAQRRAVEWAKRTGQYAHVMWFDQYREGCNGSGDDDAIPGIFDAEGSDRAVDGEAVRSG